MILGSIIFAIKPGITTDQAEQIAIKKFDELEPTGMPLLGFIFDPQTGTMYLLLPTEFLDKEFPTIEYLKLDWEIFLDSPTPFWLVDEHRKLNRMVKD